MSLLKFDSSGRLSSVGERSVNEEKKRDENHKKVRKEKEYSKDYEIHYKPNYNINKEDNFDFLKDEEDNHDFESSSRDLKKTDSLHFLNQGEETFNISKGFWDFNIEGNPISPLKFSNGKTQEDIVKEVVDLIRQGNKIIFLKGACGSGKSAIALNIARILGKASIIVPLKSLQKQYEDDYSGKKYVIKPDGKKMKIAIITGRDNHDSIINPGFSCSYSYLPENIKITEKNITKLQEYYTKSPLTENNIIPDIKEIKRFTIAASNPYWSPILPSKFDFKIQGAEKNKYLGVDSKEFIFYHRKLGCSYYDQYLAYIKADVIVFNSVKYKSELSIGRKPLTDIEIVDEADEFLDSLSNQSEINLNNLATALEEINLENISSKIARNKILEILKEEIRNKKIEGINNQETLKLSETQLEKIFKNILSSKDLSREIELNELNYTNNVLNIIKNFESNIDDAYLIYKKEKDDLLIELVSTNLSKKMKEFVDKNKAVVFMSGTLHSEEILKKVFGLKDFKIVEAEGLNQGNIEIMMTGKEFDCNYSNFKDNKQTKTDYFYALSECIKKAKEPTLIQVNAFKDLPSENEKEVYSLNNIICFNDLIQNQKDDKTGKQISDFKEGKNKILFTTKCSRGIDFPGEICNSIIFTKYPNPNTQDIFWKILQKTHPQYYWDFYKDKARREFLQRLYRALRFKEDHLYVLSPDKRVLDAVRKIQLEIYEKNKIQDKHIRNKI